ncbi:MAG: PqqD family protein [Lachnospiraceae bacterium]|nr:PqqD family protein [Lachnospiraceae bacterium]
MKLNKEFLLHESRGEAILVPTGKADFSGVVRGNKTFGAVVELLKKDTDEEKIVSAMKERFDAPEGAIEADVARILRELREIGALCE